MNARHGAAILLAAALSACDGSSFDHYVLALSWEPAFCEFSRDKPECRELDDADFAASHLTLHGLWPNSSPNDGPSYCDVDEATRDLDRPKSWCELPHPDITGSTRASLEAAMPGTRSCLEKHEWIKHGTCSGIDAISYFSDTLRLAAAMQRTRLGEAIAANIGGDLTPGQLTDAFEATFGAGSGRALTVVCTQHGGIRYLSEIRIALKPAALAGTLDRDDLYLSGPPPEGGCSGTMRIDPAGQ